MRQNTSETKRKRWDTNGSVKYLTNTETCKLLQTALLQNSRDYAMISIAYYCGLRASEVGMIRIGDVDMASGKIYIRRLKGSDRSVIVLDNSRLTAIRKMNVVHNAADPDQPLFRSRKNRPISRSQLHRIISKLGRLAGIPPAKRHWHVLKHSIAVHMLDCGNQIDIYDVQQHLGHRDIRNTMVYLKYTSSRRRNYQRVMENNIAIAR